MKEKWIVTAWDNSLEIRAIHIVDGATPDEVKGYASRLWAWFGGNLKGIDVLQFGTYKRFYIGN